MTRLVPAVESLQSYVWRRHTLAVASRLLPRGRARRHATGTSPPRCDDDDASCDGVGFADIVNYTRQSRSL